MSHLNLLLRFDTPFIAQSRRRRTLLQSAINKALGVLSGTERGGSFDIVASSTNPLAANTALILSSGSGTVGGTINGVGCTDTWASSDTGSAGLIAAAINASTNALVQYNVGATNLKSVVTLATCTAGSVLNIAGFKFTAVAAATGKDGDFSIASTDTADAVALAGAINAHPAASVYLFAIPIVGAVHVFPKSAAWFSGPNAPPNISVGVASIAAFGAATFAASAYVGIYAKLRGKLGNCQTIAASGTGVTVINTETRLMRGLGLDALPVTDAI